MGITYLPVHLPDGRTIIISEKVKGDRIDNPQEQTGIMQELISYLLSQNIEQADEIKYLMGEMK